jgi:hypothetical protein
MTRLPRPDVVAVVEHQVQQRQLEPLTVAVPATEQADLRYVWCQTCMPLVVVDVHHAQPQLMKQPYVAS